MKTKILGLVSLSVFALLFFVSFASAAISVVNSSATSVNATHNSQASFIVYVSAPSGENITNGVFVLPSLFSPSTWTGNSSSFNLTGPSNTSSYTLYVTVPQYQVAATYSGIINISNGSSLATTPLSISVVVPSSPALTVNGGTIALGSNSTTITVTNTGNTVLSNIALNSTGDFSVNFSSSTISSLAAGVTSSAITVTRTTSLSSLNFGSSTVTITANSSGTIGTGTVTQSVPYCEDVSDNGNLEATIDDINNNGFSGNKFGDEDNWFPLDELEVDILVENNGNEKIKNILVEWGVYDSSTGDWYTDDKESSFTLKDGDDKTLTLTFKLDKRISRLDSNNLIFYVKATGDDEEFDSNETCKSDSQDITAVIESDFVVIDNVLFSETVSCGEDLHITADVWNIGADDQNDVSVEIYNKELGINEFIKVGDVDSFKSISLDTLLEIPSNATEKTHSLYFSVYDEDNDIYVNDFEDDKSVFILPLAIKGGCTSSTSSALISAKLESESKAGKEMVVKTTITNTKSNSVTYLVDVSGYSEWATLTSIEPSTLIINSGESKEVMITLKPNKDAAGTKNFDIVLSTTSGSEKIVQSVSTTIESAGLLSGTLGNVFSGTSSAYKIGAILLSIGVVVVIVIIAVRLFKSNF